MGKVLFDGAGIAPTYPLSFEFFCKDVATNDSLHLVNYGGISNANKELGLRGTTGSELQLVRNNGSANVVGITSSTPRATSWQYYVVVYTSATEMHLGIDGVEVAHDGAATSIVPASDTTGYKFSIGARPGGALPINAFFSRVALYDGVALDLAVGWEASQAEDSPGVAHLIPGIGMGMGL